MKSLPVTQGQPTSWTVLLLASCLLTASSNAQQPDPRIGELREDRTANSVGLYNVFEDLGNGMIRYHIAHNLAPQNRLYLDCRCDGNFYPIRNYQGVATDSSESCTTKDGNVRVGSSAGAPVRSARTVGGNGGRILRPESGFRPRGFQGSIA